MSERKKIIRMITGVLVIALIFVPFFLGNLVKDYDCKVNQEKYGARTSSGGGYSYRGCDSWDVFGERAGAFGIGILFLAGIALVIGIISAIVFGINCASEWLYDEGTNKYEKIKKKFAKKKKKEGKIKDPNTE